jgi:hypothetical protein
MAELGKSLEKLDKMADSNKQLEESLDNSTNVLLNHIETIKKLKKKKRRLMY